MAPNFADGSEEMRMMPVPLVVTSWPIVMAVGGSLFLGSNFWVFIGETWRVLEAVLKISIIYLFLFI